MATVTLLVSRRVSQAWQGYLKMLEKYPLRMQALNTCVIMGAGDCLAQLAFERKPLIDYEMLRTSRYLGCGLVVFGPAMHVWYSWLDKVTKGKASIKVVKKVGADQLFFMPAYLMLYLALLAALRREKPADIKRHLRRDYLPCLKASYEVWPTAQVLNFFLVPSRHRVLVINLVGLFWNSYIAFKSEKKD